MYNIKFAVVREDHIIEELLIRQIKPENVLMVASGGCTVLTLKSLFPSINITLFDTNPKQIQLVQDKVKALKNAEFDNLDLEELNYHGEFESLFNSFRNFVHEFILSEQEIKEIFLGSMSVSKQRLHNLTSNKYWPVAFELFFSNALLLAMFGADAIQHAEPNSYPSYFQKVFERGFARDDFKNNYFLHHVFLGFYLEGKDNLPFYLQNLNQDIKLEFEYINNNLLNVDLINRFQLISLSNIFDWTSIEEAMSQLEYLEKNVQSGTFIVLRQLNNTHDYSNKFKTFTSHDKLASKLHAVDRSMFYNKITILEKI